MVIVDNGDANENNEEFVVTLTAAEKIYSYFVTPITRTTVLITKESPSVLTIQTAAASGSSDTPPTAISGSSDSFSPDTSGVDSVTVPVTESSAVSLQISPILLLLALGLNLLPPLIMNN